MLSHRLNTATLIEIVPGLTIFLASELQNAGRGRIELSRFYKDRNMYVTNFHRIAIVLVHSLSVILFFFLFIDPR